MKNRIKVLLSAAALTVTGISYGQVNQTTDSVTHKETIKHSEQVTPQQNHVQKTEVETRKTEIKTDPASPDVRVKTTDKVEKQTRVSNSTEMDGAKKVTETKKDSVGTKTYSK